MSSHASRVWITSARSRLVGQARSGRRTRPAARRGASGRSGSRARTRPRPRPRARPAGRRGRRRPWRASCGCTPAVAHTTPAWRAGRGDGVADDGATSVPTVTIRSTPAATRLGHHRVGRVGATSSSASQPRWQWSSVQRAGPRASGRLRRGNSGCALVDREAAGVAAPRRGVGQPLVGGRAGQADAPPHLGATRRARPGCARTATMRSASSGVAQHGVDLGAGLGLPRLVGLEVGVGLADEPPGGLERDRRLRRRPTPRPRGVAPRPPPRPAGCRPRARARCRRTSWPTTVATRDSRLPKLLARSRCSGRPSPRS